MTWTTFHHRGDVLRTVTRTVDVRRDGLLPMDVAGVRETFGDELTLLGALQLRWHTRLSGHLERALLEQPADLGHAVVGAWHATADELPGTRLVLDHYRADAARRRDGRAATTSRRQGADPAGRVSAGRAAAATEDTVAAGLELEQAARETYRPPTSDPASRGPRPARPLPGAPRGLTPDDARRPDFVVFRRRPPAGMLVTCRRSTAGMLLLASPELLDPNFADTVVLLLDADDGGRHGRGAQPAVTGAGDLRARRLGRHRGRARGAVPRRPGLARGRAGGGPGPRSRQPYRRDSASGHRPARDRRPRRRG